MWDDTAKANLIENILNKIFEPQLKKEKEYYKELGLKNGSLHKHPPIFGFMYKGQVYPKGIISYLTLDPTLIEDFYNIKKVEDSYDYKVIKNYLTTIISINNSKEFLEQLLPKPILSMFFDSTYYNPFGFPLPTKQETQEYISFIQTNYKEASELLRHILITQFLIQE